MDHFVPRILCMDDEHIYLDLLDAILLPHGYETMRVVNGSEALEKIRTQRVDICLLDVMVPGINGFEVCLQIKSDDQYSNIPVIILTADATLKSRLRGIEVGAEGFISKPFDGAEVLARIAGLLRVKRLNDQLCSAYQNITRLIKIAGQQNDDFDPLHFDFIASITEIVRNFIAGSPEKVEHPQKVLIGVPESSGEFSCYCFSQATDRLDMTILPPVVCSLLNRLFVKPGVVCLNQSDLWDQHGDLASALCEFVITPVNLICHRSNHLIFCALNYGRTVTSYDAEVSNSVVAQSLFLRSLSHQVHETEDAFAYMVNALARAAEFTDEDTGNHIVRVGDFCATLASRMGMSDQFITQVRHQSIMHDVGKIHISPTILKKPGRLEPSEFEQVKEHTIYGAAIIGTHVRLSLARSIALSHHERYDGSGYPYGLSGQRIPIEGRIVTLADHYDALRNARCYKPAYDHDTSCRIIIEGDGRTLPQHFDPAVLAAFKQIHGRFAEIFEAQRQLG